PESVLVPTVTRRPERIQGPLIRGCARWSVIVSTYTVRDRTGGTHGHRSDGLGGLPPSTTDRPATRGCRPPPGSAPAHRRPPPRGGRRALSPLDRLLHEDRAGTRTP